jgi:hypothetical protein
MAAVVLVLVVFIAGMIALGWALELAADRLRRRFLGR